MSTGLNEEVVVLENPESVSGEPFTAGLRARTYRDLVTSILH